MNTPLWKRPFFACLIAAALMTVSCSGGGSSSSPVVVTSGSGSVSGVVRYQDKEYNRNGFTGTNPFKTVRFATVQVVDTSSKAVLAAGTTGTDGSYSLSYTGAGTYVYVRVLTQAEISGSVLVRVRNSSGLTYAVGTGSFTSGGAVTYNMDIDLVSLSQVTGAYNILDVLTTGMQFAQGLAGAYPPQLSAFWEYNGTDGTYYCSSGCLPGAGMYVFGNYNGDTDGYDDDVILHEFGHFLADTYSRDDSMGGAHYLGDNKEDLRLSWSEGWGNFMPIAVRHWQTINDPNRISSTDSASSIYVDTNDGVPPPFDPINFYIVLGNPLDNNVSGWGCGTENECFSYSSNELAIANLLWNSMTGTGNFGMQPIWRVINSWHGLSTFTLPIVNLEAFWDTWISQRSPGGNEYDAAYAAELNTLWNVYNTVNIKYKKDQYENDGSSNIAIPISLGALNAQTHTLYSGWGQDDSDYYAFTTSAAGNFSAATSDLANGADTFITVRDESGANVITSNDNANYLTYVPCGGTINKCAWGNYDYYYLDSQGNYANSYPINNLNTLSSRAAFNSTGAANYFIEVKPSPNRPNSAGRYGTYTLTITEQ